MIFQIWLNFANILPDYYNIKYWRTILTTYKRTISSICSLFRWAVTAFGEQNTYSAYYCQFIILPRLKKYLKNIKVACWMVSSKTMYNRTVNSPQNVKSLSVLSPGIGSWNAFAIYQVWFYHITTSNYAIDPIKKNTYFTSHIDGGLLLIFIQ